MDNHRIRNIYARQILNSGGYPSVSTTIELNSGLKMSASVPSGQSRGKFEAFELVDNDKSLYNGKSVYNAIGNVNDKISKVLIGKSILEQRKLDELMIDADGTENKEKFGANAILSTSVCIAKLASRYLNIPLYKYIGGINGVVLPTPMMNILNGGAHSNNGLEIQEFMITPVGAKSFMEAIKMGCEVFYALKDILIENNLSTALGSEGGFAPFIKTNGEALDLIIKAIDKTNYSTDDIKICLDLASSRFYKDGIYEIKSENLKLNSNEMCNYIKNLIEDYPIISIEDGMAENDYEGWRKLTDTLKDKVLLVGDDLFCTNQKLLKEGINDKIGNAIIIKPNQIGTISETIEVVRLAKFSNYKTIISHRSNETCETFISDLSVGLNSGLIKAGSVARGERVAKYNRLLEIELELNSEFSACSKRYAKFLGENAYLDEFRITDCNRCNKK